MLVREKQYGSYYLTPRQRDDMKHITLTLNGYPGGVGLGIGHSFKHRNGVLGRRGG
jgi:hypothetical protein